MEKDSLNGKREQVLQVLSVIPQKILSLYGRENIAEFVLHDLSHESCFDLKKAAFFADNPDFNCLKGVAGISKAEMPKGLWSDVWDQNEKFSTYMRNSTFNKKVREFEQCSIRADKKFDHEAILGLAKNLGIDNPSYHSVELKHGNTGIFVFEKSPESENNIEKHLICGISLFGFCPIF